MCGQGMTTPEVGASDVDQCSEPLVARVQLGVAGFKPVAGGAMAWGSCDLQAAVNWGHKLSSRDSTRFAGQVEQVVA
jgi:hypothetical protein